MNKRIRWASKEEAKQYALSAESKGNMGLSYCAACDFLGWNVAARRKLLEENKKSSKKQFLK